MAPDTQPKATEPAPVDSFYAVQKPIERVRPGCWVQAWEDGADSWVRVSAVLSLTHNETGKPATELRGVDLSGEPARMREWNGSMVSVITKAKAKQAGLQVDSKAALGGSHDYPIDRATLGGHSG